MSRRRAFTLIELLVVIAIIAILAAILFPVFAQAKEAAKKTTCLSNTKQIAVGLYMYTSDYDDTFPNTSWEQDSLAKSGTPGFGGTYNPQNPAGTFQIHWTFLIQPYIHNWNIFVCPSDPAPTPTDNKCTNGTADIGKLVGGVMTCDWEAQSNSYIPAYNAMPAHDWLTVSSTQFTSPSNQIVVAEHRNDLILTDGHKGVSGFWPSQPCGQLGVGTNSVLPSPGTATNGTVSTAGGYIKFNANFIEQAYTAAKAATIGTTASGKFFKAYDVLRVADDRHTSGQGANYSYADGHAKYQKLGQVLDANNYQFGDQWLPRIQTWNAGSPIQGGACN